MVSVNFQNGAYVPHGFDGTDQWHKVPDPRRRTQIKFWVDLDKDLGQWAIEAMKTLKGERMFKTTMMQGFRLVIELRNKKLDYLFELFPFIEAWMDSEIEREVTRRLALAQPKPDQSDLEARLAKLEALLSAQTKLAPQPVAAPDDDALVMRKVASDGKQSASNFRDSVMKLQG